MLCKVWLELLGHSIRDSRSQIMPRLHCFITENVGCTMAIMHVVRGILLQKKALSFKNKFRY